MCPQILVSHIHTFETYPNCQINMMWNNDKDITQVAHTKLHKIELLCHIDFWQAKMSKWRQSCSFWTFIFTYLIKFSLLTWEAWFDLVANILLECKARHDSFWTNQMVPWSLEVISTITFVDLQMGLCCKVEL